MVLVADNDTYDVEENDDDYTFLFEKGTRALNNIFDNAVKFNILKSWR